MTIRNDLNDWTLLVLLGAGILLAAAVAGVRGDVAHLRRAQEYRLALESMRAHPTARCVQADTTVTVRRMADRSLATIRWIQCSAFEPILGTDQ